MEMQQVHLHQLFTKTQNLGCRRTKTQIESNKNHLGTLDREPIEKMITRLISKQYIDDDFCFCNVFHFQSCR